MTGGPAPDRPLPRLREDLEVVRRGSSLGGAPTWLVLDPARNRFFNVTYELFQLLSLWNKSTTAGELIAAVRRDYGREAAPDELAATLRMLTASYFLAPAVGTWRQFHARSKKAEPWYMRLVHNYLFFKLPLVRPEAFLRRTWPLVAPLFSRAFMLISAAVGLVGLYLVSRQWDIFLNNFPFFFTPEGLLVSVVSLVLVKSLHEAAHGYSAHRLGCRVPTMGLAFMFLVPMLYSDVTDAWRLKSARARFLIDSAGIAAELSVAAFALLLWVFLPDGPPRSAMFVLATTSWMMSLLLNLNPCMRFDGYYMLSDLVGIDNLQPRAFSHLRWRIRRLLFGLADPPVDAFPGRVDAFVTLYAAVTALYRLILFLGIALAVYHFFIKAVGILLFVVEIWFFVARPIFAELQVWWRRRADILGRRRTYVTLGVAAGLVLSFFLPLASTARVPALLMPKHFSRLYPSEQARIVAIHVKPYQRVSQGEPLFMLEAPALASERRIAIARLALAVKRLARIGAHTGDLVERGILEGERAALQATVLGLAEREAKLMVRAPVDGWIHDLNPTLSIGRWVSRVEELAFLAGYGEWTAQGYIKSDDQTRVEIGARGAFIPDDLTVPKMDLRLAASSISTADQITIAQLTSEHGGPVAVTRSPDGRLVPVEAVHVLTAELAVPAETLTQSIPGMIVLDAAPQSAAAHVWKHVLKVLIRESGS